ncbi:hypothetical protein IV500_06330 [Paeniglutamicibacter antarcticus]|uniref:Uncharacterized protein n=1 Tax=Arthrobacter terrae TaxID=2935737 RepID=A0A931G9T4_9MICC|nr:hypothetical protein [Arthrobacter terrae]MBG0739017.1 hypothetical protein [Arthrobacter terrae]
MRYVMAAVAVALLVTGAFQMSGFHWEGLVALLVGGSLWWASLYLSRAAWQAARDGRPGK